MERPDPPYTDEDLLKQRDKNFFKEVDKFYNLTSIKKRTNEPVDLESVASAPITWPAYKEFMSRVTKLEEGIDILSPNATLAFISTFVHLVNKKAVDEKMTYSKKLYEEINDPLRRVRFLDLSGFESFNKDVSTPGCKIDCYEGHFEGHPNSICLWTGRKLKSDTQFVVYSILCPSRKYYAVSYKNGDEKLKRIQVINSLIFSFKIEEFILDEISKFITTETKKKRDTSVGTISENVSLAKRIYMKMCLFNSALKSAFAEFSPKEKN